MAKMLKGTGDFDPPEDVDPPECDECHGKGSVWDYEEPGYARSVMCGECHGTGYQPEAETDPTDDADFPPYEGP